jgi:glycogen synthase
MEDIPKVQLICVGPIGDLSGAKAQAELEAVAELFPGRMWCPRNRYVTGELRELLWHASDWCLCPSRFEPCGLVDIEFGWNGALIIGHNTGGRGG